MDSNEFQKIIDDQIRNVGEENNRREGGSNEGVKETGDVKGKGAEGEQQEEGTNQEEEGQDEGQGTEETIKSTKQPKGRTPGTRQSKRKNGEAPEVESYQVGPIRIKKPKGKPNEEGAASTSNIPPP